MQLRGQISPLLWPYVPVVLHILFKADIWCPDLSEIHVEPLSVTLPTGIPSHQSKVEFTTTGVIWLGFFYLVYKVVRLGQRMDKAKSNVAKTKVS